MNIENPNQKITIGIEIYWIYLDWSSIKFFLTILHSSRHEISLLKLKSIISDYVLFIQYE